MNIDYVPLFILFAIAWLVPMVLSWMNFSKLSGIVVEITMGVLVGPYVFGWISGSDPYLEFLSYTGFLFLIFLSGLALDMEKIFASFPRFKDRIRRIDILGSTFLMALFIYVGTLLLSVLVVHFLPFFDGIDKPFLVLLLPSVALSIVVPIIKNDSEINKKFGQMILLEGAVSTIITILTLTVYVGIKKHNGFEFELLLFPIIFVVFFLAYKVGVLLVKTDLFQRLLYQLEHTSSQIRIRGAVAVLLLFVVISKWIHTEPVLGAFFAGTLLSMFLPKERSALLFKLDGMSYGFFIPIFFIMVGVKLDIGSLQNMASSLRLIVVLTASFYITQVIPTLLLTGLFGLKKSLSSGVLLTSRLGLTIAMAQLGLSLDLISTAVNTGIVASSIITCLLSPLLYTYLSHNTDRHYRIYVVGGGKIALELAKRLNMHSVSHLIIEPVKEQWNILKSMGINSLHADVEDLSTYRSMEIRMIDTLVVLTNSNDKNRRIAEMLRKELQHPKVITVTNTPALYSNSVALSGVETIDFYQVIASKVEDVIMRPSTTDVLVDSFGTYRMEEILVGNERVNRECIKDIPFPHSGSLVAIKREHEMFIPHGDTHLLKGDRVTVIGNALALNVFRELIE